MDVEMLRAMKERRSVRSYADQKIEGEVLQALRECIDECNRESGLNIQLCIDEPKAFDGFMAHYGTFKNVKNYIVLVGKKEKDLDEKCGYWGEKIVIRAQQLGLNTCWVGMTYKKGQCRCQIEDGEKLCCVISVGYGAVPGNPHKVKDIGELSQVKGEMPDWFRKGVEAAQLAPTAINQQKFLFSLDGDEVSAKSRRGFFTKVDLGIAKYHFEVGAGNAAWKWKK